MPIFELTKDSLIPLVKTTFANQGIRERLDLQRLLRSNINAIDDELDDELYVLAEEFGDWDDSTRRIDLLCIDRQANLVVVELKRSEDGGHMDLQAIRYAAMVHLMTFEQAIEAHRKYLKDNWRPEEPEAAILKFLNWGEAQPEAFAKEVRIILVSAEFSKKIASSVLWLNERELDIKCVRMKPYPHGSTVLLDIQQVIPLPEAVGMTIQIREKAAEVRQAARESLNDYTRYDLKIEKQSFPNLGKRNLIFSVVQWLIAKGTKPEEIMKFIPRGKWLWVEGEWNPEQFAVKALSKTTPGNLSRFFTGSSELFVVNGTTYALSKMFSKHDLPALKKLLEANPQFNIEYKETSVDPSST